MADTEQPMEGQEPAPAPAKEPEKKDKELEIRHYTIVPLPKIVFFYPLLILAIVCGIMEVINGMEDSSVAGTLFIIMFLLNVMVISFDFPGVKALALAMGVLAIIFGLILLDREVFDRKLLGALGDVIHRLYDQLHASSAFYFCISAILCCMIVGGVLGNILWNRWTIEHNRLKHKDGLFSYKEYPVIDLQVEKEVEDVFEYLLLGAGTLTFRIPNNPRICLENVPFIKRAERRIQKIGRQLHVKTN